MPIKYSVIVLSSPSVKLLPANKSIPDELLTLVDKPIINQPIEEAIDLGIKKIILISTEVKDSITSYLKSYFNDIDITTIQRSIDSDIANTLLFLKPLLNEAFTLSIPYYLIDKLQNSSDNLKRMIDQYKVSNLSQMMVHKEMQAGRYVLTPEILEILEKDLASYQNKKLEDVIAVLQTQQYIREFQINNKVFDCSNKLGYIEASLSYALQHKELREDFAKLIQKQK